MNLQTDSIPRLLWRFSIPSLIGTLANAIYNIVDRIYIGQSVGALAISGLALTFPLMNLLGAFGMLVGQGAAARVSLMLGNGKLHDANSILPNTLFLSTIIYLTISSLCYIFLDKILIAFGGSELTIPYARNYMQVIIPGHIFTSLSFAFNNIMRAAGHPMLAMYTLLIGAVLNIILDPVFLYVFGMGIEGVAYATVISMFISMVWIMQFFLKKKHTLHFRRNTLKISIKTIWAILSIGLSPFLLHVGLSAVNLIMNQTMKTYGGDLAIGAFGIITSYTSLIIMAIIGLCQGMQPIIGYNYGAQQFTRVRHTLKLCVIIATIIVTIGWLLAMATPELIAGCFTSDPELLAITVNGIKIYTAVFFIVGFQVVTVNYFQSVGRAGVSIFLSLSRQILFLIPTILLLPSLWGLNGAWMAQPVADVLSVATACIVMHRHLKKLSA